MNQKIYTKENKMNPAMIIIIILMGIGIWFVFARKDVFVKTENFIDESIEMGIYENTTDIEYEVKNN